MIQFSRKNIPVNLLYHMIRIRMVENAVAELSKDHQIRTPIYLSTGQEAIAAGVCTMLSRHDLVYGHHRSIGHYLAKGGDIKKLFAELMGREQGCCKGRGGSCALIDTDVGFMGTAAYVGAGIPLAAGMAMAEKLNGSKSTVTVFFGDAAVEQGVFHETLNFSALRKLPLLMICENNHYASYTAIDDRQPSRPIMSIAQAQGMVAFKEDGNDALKVQDLARKAVSIIGMMGGPVFVEFTTYRERQHKGYEEDNIYGHKRQGEFEQLRRKDPIEWLESYLVDENVIEEYEIDEFERSIAQEISEAIDWARSSFVDHEHYLNEVYSTE